VTSWTPEQSRALTRAIDEGATIAYWCSDAHGYPCNGGRSATPARSGQRQVLDSQLEPCSKRALHATLEPHRWIGSRVWVVALRGVVYKDDTKLAALDREILGEVLPHEAWTPSVGARLGRKDLEGADLCGARLESANLRGADFTHANLREASLANADLRGADLTSANLRDACLTRADLRDANLTDANLASTNLAYANFEGAHLAYASLVAADLAHANLERTNLEYVDCRNVNFVGVSLKGARFETR